MTGNQQNIAILIPCYNEEQTVAKVITDFREELPNATIYVYDNNSKDKSADIARNCGAVVIREPRQGKGNVVRSMFRDVEADVYVMVDGDATYPAESVHDLIQPIVNRKADMVIGDRFSNGSYVDENKRRFHGFGNSLVLKAIRFLFQNDLHDIMTGYRAFSRFFVKTMPVLSPGFEIETEMTIHALDKKFLLKEVPIDYRDRPEGSYSKLNTYRDGFKVLKTIFSLFKNYKPFPFFATVSAVIAIFGLATGALVIYEFMLTHYISHMPSAILSVGLILSAIVLFINGMILDTVVKNHKFDYELNLNLFKEVLENGRQTAKGEY
jgi:glycosyltransferase involved in cell wall biosynthesis